MKRNEYNLRDIWDNVKCPNIQIIRLPEEEDRKKGHEKILEEIIVEKIPKMGKEIVTQVIGFAVQLPSRVQLKFAQVHVHCIGDTIQPSHPLTALFSLCPQSFSASGTFPMSHLFPSDDQNTGVSASASVLPMSIQG